MKENESQPSERGVIPCEKMRELEDGMTEAEVLTVLGPPKHVLCPDTTETPTNFFRELGWTIIDFEACRNLDAVWLYEHDRRGKFELVRRLKTFVGIRDGQYTAHWGG